MLTDTPGVEGLSDLTRSDRSAYLESVAVLRQAVVAAPEVLREAGRGGAEQALPGGRVRRDELPAPECCQCAVDGRLVESERRGQFGEAAAARAGPRERLQHEQCPVGALDR